MNAIPQPADLSKLKGILGKAKAVMNTVEEGNFKKGNIDESILTQDTSSYANTLTPQMGNNNFNTPVNNVQRPITEEAIRKSKMPEAIKKAMLENPIQQPTINHTFSLDDVSDLIAPSKNMETRRVNESAVKQSNDNVVVSKELLKEMIKDVLIEYLTNDFSKQLTENAIKKTINTLIKEGKIKPKN